LRDDPAGARPLGGGQQVIGAPGPQLVRDGEQLVGIAETSHAHQSGHLVHDHLRPGGTHRRDHRLAIQPVDNHRLRARLAQLRDLAGRPGGGGDLVTRRDQPRNQVPSQRPGRSRDEDSHDLSFRVVLSLEDKAPPEAVTVFNPAFPTARARSRPAGLPRLGRKNDLHAASHAVEPTRTPRQSAICAQRTAMAPCELSPSVTAADPAWWRPAGGPGTRPHAGLAASRSHSP
jgi:hypothetical protein